MTATSYPLFWPEGWPRTADTMRKNSSQFQTTFERARRHLHEQLRMIGARNVVLSSWLPLRNDGEPRADAARRRIEDPGVALYFTLRDKPMVMARDAYWNVHDNLRSIGLAVEHLRGLERHGGGLMMEKAFAGFTAIEHMPEHSTWWAILGLSRTATVNEINEAFKLLSKVRHPDALTGSHEAMSKLTEARSAALKEKGA